MKMISKVLLTAAAIAALAAPAMAAPGDVKLKVRDDGNTADVFSVANTGSVNINDAFYWDGTNKRLGIGTATPSYMVSIINAAGPGLLVQRANNSTTNALTGFAVDNNDITAGNGIAFSLTSVDSAGGAYAGAVLGAVFTSHTQYQHTTDLTFRTTNRNLGSSPLERLRISAKGNVLAGNLASMSTGPLANTATDGFFYIPAVAGLPTGVPTAYTGMVPMQYDTTNSKLCLYNGGWKCITWN